MPNCSDAAAAWLQVGGRRTGGDHLGCSSLVEEDAFSERAYLARQGWKRIHACISIAHADTDAEAWHRILLLELNRPAVATFAESRPTDDAHVVSVCTAAPQQQRDAVIALMNVIGSEGMRYLRAVSAVARKFFSESVKEPDGAHATLDMPQKYAVRLPYLSFEQLKVVRRKKV